MGCVPRYCVQLALIKIAVMEAEGYRSIREKLSEARASPMRAYVDLTAGADAGLPRFLLYEFLTFFLGPLPGGLGLLLRKKLYPLLFRRAGGGLVLGRGLTVRHPRNIELGDNVVIDEYSLIDGRGAGAAGLRLEDGVVINRNCMIQAKAAPIRLGPRTSIGSNSVIVRLTRFKRRNASCRMVSVGRESRAN